MSEDAKRAEKSTYRVVRPEGEEAEVRPMAVLDISTTSCRIATEEPVPERAQLELTVAGPELDETVELKGQVVWSRRSADSAHSYAAAVDLSPPGGEELRILRDLPEFFDLRKLQVERELVEIIPRVAAMEMKIVPFRYDEEEDAVHLATSVWHSRETIETLSRQFGHDLVLHYAPSQDIVRAIRFLYGTVSGAEGGASPGTAFLQNMLEEAHELRASDIHIQPGETCQVRYRVDGVMGLGPALEEDLYRNLVNRIKVEAGLDIAERRDAMDGAFEWETPDGQHRDVRVATIPTVLGEHVSLRLFGPGDRPSRITELGLSEQQVEVLREALGQPQGLIVTVGPTGAGKTTTLYAALREIDRTDNHVITMEDPVEHRFVNVTQIEIHGHSKMAVSNMLRSVLRHDPDMVVVGEMRDEETLHLTMQSALSGALTLAALQADDAPSAPVRLLNMGAPDYVLASNLRLVIAQRLVRRLCESCKTSTTLGEERARRLGLEPGLEVFEPGACKHCNYMGYLGRVAAFELMPSNRRVRRLILEQAATESFREAATEAGMVSMLQRAAQYVACGITNAAEALRCVPHGPAQDTGDPG